MKFILISVNREQNFVVVEEKHLYFDTSGCASSRWFIVWMKNDWKKLNPAFSNRFLLKFPVSVTRHLQTSNISSNSRFILIAIGRNCNVRRKLLQKLHGCGKKKTIRGKFHFTQTVKRHLNVCVMCRENHLRK